MNHAAAATNAVPFIPFNIVTSPSLRSRLKSGFCAAITV